MKIYTRTGDTGTTALFGGKRISKSDLRIETYGTVDELNSYLGLLRDLDVNQGRKDVLVGIQDRLFTIGSILATEPGNSKVKIPELKEGDIQLLEQEIDGMESSLPPLKTFILPGGHPAVSWCHIARTVCRRSERLAVALDLHEKLNPRVIAFLNRLSDFLFVLSRKMARELGAEEIPWKPTL